MSADWVANLVAGDLLEEVVSRETPPRQVRLVEKDGKDSHGRERWLVTRVGEGRVKFTRLAEGTIRRFWRRVDTVGGGGG